MPRAMRAATGRGTIPVSASMTMHALLSQSRNSTERAPPRKTSLMSMAEFGVVIGLPFRTNVEPEPSRYRDCPGNQDPIPAWNRRGAENRRDDVFEILFCLCVSAAEIAF